MPKGGQRRRIDLVHSWDCYAALGQLFAVGNGKVAIYIYHTNCPGVVGQSAGVDEGEREQQLSICILSLNYSSLPLECPQICTL